MVGNYGVAPARSESRRAHARAVLMREARGPQWTDWLHEHGVVGLTGVDTRSLVLHLRERGAMRAAAIAGDVDVDEVLQAVREQPRMAGAALVAGVSCREPYTFADEGAVRVAVYDGVLLSPGPGDPAPLVHETRTVQELLGRTNVLGVCLGHQLIAQATGRETFKLPFGHRGANHPVLDHRTRRVLVTSQNHGFAVRAADNEHVTHSSLYDGTVEGLSYPALRARSAQFHPEASPGPHDAAALLEGWVEELRAA